MSPNSGWVIVHEFYNVNNFGDFSADFSVYLSNFLVILSTYIV